jgi:hypothetical protein
MVGCYSHAVTSCHASFPLSQEELAASVSSSGNTSSRRFQSRAEIEALNPHHRCRLSSLNCPTLNIHCYKKFISTLTTLPPLNHASILPPSYPKHYAIGAPPVVIVPLYVCVCVCIYIYRVSLFITWTQPTDRASARLTHVPVRLGPTHRTNRAKSHADRAAL